MKHKSKKGGETKEKKARRQDVAIKAPKFLSAQIKRKNILKDIVENGRSFRSAAKAQGYSDAIANHPTKITKSKSWQELLNHYLPQSKLLEVHDQQLRSYKLNSMIMQKGIDDETVYELIESVEAIVKKIVDLPTGRIVFYITSDNQSRNKALEMGLKLHKKLTDKVEVKDTTPYGQLSDAELAEKIKKGKNFFTKK